MSLQLASPAGICVSVAGENMAETLAVAKRSESFADVVEVRLDSLSQPDVAQFVKELAKPVLFTNRPEWEGGRFRGAETERVALLLEAIRLDCSLVDLELKTSPELRGELLDLLIRHPRTSLIVSWHDFSGTPASDALGNILQQQMDSGAHIGKIVTMAHDYSDVLRVLNLLPVAARNSFPLVAFCMGAVGMISRLATVKLGGYMTYGSPENGSATAPGQIPVSSLRTMLRELDDAD